MGILYCIYGGDFSRKYSVNLHEGSVCKIWSISKNYIRQRHEIYSSILKSFYGRIRNQGSNIYSLSSTDRWIDRKVGLDTKMVFKALYQLYIK